MFIFNYDKPFLNFLINLVLSLNDIGKESNFLLPLKTSSTSSHILIAALEVLEVNKASVKPVPTNL